MNFMVILSVLITYPCNKWKFKMVLHSNSSVRPLRVSPVQQVAIKLAQELKEYSFGLKESLCEPQESPTLHWWHIPAKPTTEVDRILLIQVKGENNHSAKNWRSLHYILTDGKEQNTFSMDENSWLPEEQGKITAWYRVA